MALVHAGIDPTVIAPWMGHASVAGTKPCIHADMTLNQQVGCRRPAHPAGRQTRPLPGARRTPRLPRRPV